MASPLEVGEGVDVLGGVDLGLGGDRVGSPPFALFLDKGGKKAVGWDRGGKRLLEGAVEVVVVVAAEVELEEAFGVLLDISCMRLRCLKN